VKKSLGEASHFQKVFCQAPLAAPWQKLGPAKQSSSTCFLIAFQHLGMLVTDVEINQLRAEIQPALVVAVPETRRPWPRFMWIGFDATLQPTTKNIV